MTSRSISRSRKPIAGMCRTLKFTFSMPVISRWTRLRMRSPHWSKALLVLHVEGYRFSGRCRTCRSSATRTGISACADCRSAPLTGAGPRSAAPSDPLTLGQLGPLGPPAGRGRAFYLAGGGSPRLRRIIRDFPRLLCPRGKRRGPRVWNADGSLRELWNNHPISGSGAGSDCTYTHDDLGRIASVTCGAIWAQTFTLDPFGNVRKDATTGTSFSADFNLANQVRSIGGNHGVYDLNGNLQNDPAQSEAVVNTFDSENKAVTLEGIDVLYDAFGRAAKAAGPGYTVEFVYGPGGGKLAVMRGQSLAVRRRR